MKRFMNTNKLIVKLRGKSRKDTGCIICGNPNAEDCTVHELQLLGRNTSGSVYSYQGRRTTSTYQWIDSFSEPICKKCIRVQSLIYLLPGLAILAVSLLLLWLSQSHIHPLLNTEMFPTILIILGLGGIFGSLILFRFGITQLVEQHSGDILLKNLYANGNQNQILVTRKKWDSMKG